MQNKVYIKFFGLQFFLLYAELVQNIILVKYLIFQIQLINNDPILTRIKKICPFSEKYHSQAYFLKKKQNVLDHKGGFDPFPEFFYHRPLELSPTTFVNYSFHIFYPSLFKWLKT